MDHPAGFLPVGRVKARRAGCWFPGAGAGNLLLSGFPDPACCRVVRKRQGDREMPIMAWIIVGIIAGWIAKRMIPGEGPGGVLGDLVIGVVGAVVGGWIFNYFGHPGATGVNIGSIVVAFVGAVVVLWMMRLFTGTRGARPA